MEPNPGMRALRHTGIHLLQGIKHIKVFSSLALGPQTVWPAAYGSDYAEIGTSKFMGNAQYLLIPSSYELFN